MPFSEDLWDGFEKVLLKISLNQQVCKDYVDWFNKMAKIEKYYADYLVDLCKVHPGGRNAAVDKEEKTLKEALVSTSETGTRVGQKHLDLYNQIVATIVKPLEAFLKQAEAERKKLNTDGAAKIKALTDATYQATKAKDNYVKLCKEFESAKEYHQKTEAELTATPEAKRARIQVYLAKAAAKLQLCQEKAITADKAYKTAVQAANDYQKKLYSELMPAILADLQKLAEDQFRSLEKAMKTYLALQKGLLPERGATNELMTARIDAELSWNDDLQEFINATRSQVGGPTPIEYTAFVGKDGPVTAESSKAPEPAAASPAAVAAEKKEEPAAEAPAAPAQEEKKVDAPAERKKADANLFDPLNAAKPETADPVDNLFS